MSGVLLLLLLLLLLLPVPVIQGQFGWRVTYTSTEICAVKGSTVEIRCSYTHTPEIKGLKIKVEETLWFIRESNGVYVDLRTDSEYSGRVTRGCDENICYLTISDLTESDSAEYKFRFTTNQPAVKYIGSPGVSLTVTDLQVKVISLRVYKPVNWAVLKCQSSCRPPGGRLYVWYNNGQKMMGRTSESYSVDYKSADSVSCAVGGFEAFPSPSVYGPKLPSVSVSPSEIVEGSSVTLTCSSDANPAANYTWYKKNQTGPHGEEPQLVFSSIQSSDSGQYLCEAENHLGKKRSEFISIDVKYGPRLPSVSVSPSEIVEGSSVTLSCSSDANPAANYTWYKKNQTSPHGEGDIYCFTSISSEDRGIYYCKAENQHEEITSSSLVIDVQYGPRLPSVSASPSAEIVEGSSVTLSCCSDANPAANYTWYKEDEDSPTASGQIFIINDFRAEHSGSYSCEAQNNRGRSNSTFHLTVLAGAWKSVAAVTIPVVLLALVLLAVFLWIRRKKSDGGERAGNRAQLNVDLVYDVASAPAPGRPAEHLHYSSVRFAPKPEEALYSNIRPAHGQTEDEVEYTAVQTAGAGSAAPRTSRERQEDSFALYSTVNK